MSCRLVVAVAALAVATPAAAATKNGITPLRPKAGATLKRGTTPTFTMRVRGKGSVIVRVCGRARRNADGLICRGVAWGKATKRAGVYRYRPRRWTRRRGTYYWQAHRVDCSGGFADCFKEGPVRRLRVR